MRKPKHMNKRQAKKWNKYCDDADWVQFMVGAEVKCVAELNDVLREVDRMCDNMGGESWDIQTLQP